jgi:uncharacterized protein
MPAEAKYACPKCHSALIHLRCKGMLIEMCSGCGGMWFDAGELTMLLQVYRKFTDLEGKTTKFSCIRCKDTLKELDFPGTDILIDRCSSCQAIWLDKGELEILKKNLIQFVPKDHPDMGKRTEELLGEIEEAGKQRFSCPKCQGKLWHLKRSGMIVEMCSKCEGMWFDAGELTILIEVYRKYTATEGKDVEVACVRCGENMKEVDFPGTEVLIDRCPSCQGIWLDKGEFEDLKEAVKSIVPENDKTWAQRAEELFATASTLADDRSKCPKCGGGLAEGLKNGVQVEICIQCGGTWFDSGELTVVLGVSRRIRMAKKEATGLFCIKCPKEELFEVPYPNTEVMIDTCPDCRSVWLDGGELEKLAKACHVTLETGRN